MPYMSLRQIQAEARMRSAISQRERIAIHIETMQRNREGDPDRLAFDEEIRKARAEFRALCDVIAESIRIVRALP